MAGSVPQPRAPGNDLRGDDRLERLRPLCYLCAVTHRTLTATASTGSSLLTTRGREVRRTFGVVLSGVVLSHIVTGCGLMSDQQKVATGGRTGAAGRADKATTDDAKSGVAIVGGWAIGESRVAQVQPRGQAAAAAAYTQANGTVATIDRIVVTPQQLKPGDQATFQAQYTVLSPREADKVKVVETRTIVFENRRVVDLPPRALLLAQGTHEIQDSFRLPRDAAAGLYLVVVSLASAADARKVDIATPFVVRTATPVVGTSPALPVRPQPVEKVSPGIPAPQPVPQALYVKIAAASIREGAGARFKLLRQVPQGTRLQLLEAGGTETDRWFKVRLAGGQEGWVAASAVASNP
jgi:hypothetical protein